VSHQQPMTRSRLVLTGVVVVALLGLWWGGRATGVLGGANDAGEAATRSHRTIGRDFQDALATGRARGAQIPWAPPQRLDGAVTISGAVIDKQSGTPVGSVEVVFRSAAGEETAMAEPDGTYRIDLPAGVYRAFVRDDTVLSVGQIDHVRLPNLPSVETAGVPDEALMPTVVASHDTEHVDLSVLRGGVVSGHVVDRAGRPIKNAVLRARGPDGVKPTLGTDVAETDATGLFELRLPAGQYELEASHPRYAGLAESSQISVVAGDHVTADLTLTAGCVIAGRVQGPGGRVAGDGAIEKQWGTGDLEFSPTGKIASDGTFRWATTEETQITLRAWPWKAPPSPSRSFACRDGARFDNVVFELPDRSADIEGILVDASGAGVAFAFIDLAPLDPGGISQQERTDADGKWSVFHMPTGRYHLTAHAPGRGVVAATVNSPQAAVRLALGGIGRIEGTTALLANGSFELRLVSCADGTARVAIPEDRRLVTVTGGRFALDNVPACDLHVIASWQRRTEPSRVTVPANGVGRVELALGPARTKQVYGVVRDDAGRPIEGAHVIAVLEGDAAADEATAVSDATGRFSIDTFSGASLTASTMGRAGFAAVGMANVDREQVDIVIHDHHDDGAEEDLVDELDLDSVD